MDEEMMKVGETVVLKSGSPEMTVVFTSGTTIECGWFYIGQYSVNTFPAEALILVNKNPEVLNLFAAFNGTTKFTYIEENTDNG